MDAPRLLAKVSEHRIALLADGDRLFYRPKERLPSVLLALLREHKAEVLEILPFWSRESAEAVRRFGAPEAWLLPYLGATVSTVLGEGILIQVTSSLVSVGLDQWPRRAAFLDWQDVRPVLPSLDVGEPNA